MPYLFSSVIELLLIVLYRFIQVSVFEQLRAHAAEWVVIFCVYLWKNNCVVTCFGHTYSNPWKHWF